MASEGFHEDAAQLRPETKDMHRAATSLMEELEAIDWYNQRVDAVDDQELGEILAHNRDEEKEHAAMVLEWIRRQDGTMDRMLRQYLFTEADILEIEEAAEAPEGGGTAAPRASGAGDLGIRSLRHEEPNL